jgi:hypothetical protein
MMFRGLLNWFVYGQSCESLGEALECCKQSLMGDSIVRSEDQNSGRKNVDSKTIFMQFQVEMRTLLEIRLEATCVKFWQRTC